MDMPEKNSYYTLNFCLVPANNETPYLTNNQFTMITRLFQINMSHIVHLSYNYLDFK